MAPTGPTGPVWRCPLTGVDWKWLAEGQTGAFEPERTLGRSGWGRLLAFSHSSPRRKSARLNGTKLGS